MLVEDHEDEPEDKDGAGNGNPLPSENPPIPPAGMEKPKRPRWHYGRAGGRTRSNWRPNWAGVPGPEIEPSECDIEVSRRRAIVALSASGYKFAQVALPAEHAERIATGLRDLNLHVAIGPSASEHMRAVTIWKSGHDEGDGGGTRRDWRVIP